MSPKEMAERLREIAAAEGRSGLDAIDQFLISMVTLLGADKTADFIGEPRPAREDKFS